MIYRNIRMFSASLIAFGLSTVAQANLTYLDSFNQVSVAPLRNDDGGGIAAGSGRVEGLATLDVSRTSSSNLPGEVIGRGEADYDSLKVFVQVSGSITDHYARAISNEVFTISDPTVAAGTSATMHLTYRLAGMGKAIDGDGASVAGEWVFASLQVSTNREASGIGGTDLSLTQVELSDGGAVLPGTGNGIHVDVPFVYDKPFTVTSDLFVRVQSDAVFTGDGFGNITKLDGDIELLEGDFGNSADIAQIFIPEGASLTTGSGFDFSPIVRYGTPVPLPAAGYLMGSVLLGLGLSMSIGSRKRHSIR